MNERNSISESNSSSKTGRKNKKRVTGDQIDRTREGLKNLLKSPYITREAAVKVLSNECRELLEKGYGYPDLAVVFRENGITINETILRDILTGKVESENFETRELKGSGKPTGNSRGK